MASKKPTYGELHKRNLELEKSLADSNSGYAGQNSTEETYREIYNYFDEAVIVQDLDTGKFLDVNKGFCRMYGISYEDALSDDLFERLDTYPPYSEADLVEWVRKTRDEGPQTFEWLARKKDGDRFWVNVSLKKAIIDGRERGLAIIRDITEQKRNKEALEKRILALTQPLDNVSKIAFEDLFNLDDIQRLQDEFAAATGVASLITNPDGVPITRQSNFSRMCRDFIRQTEKGRARCIQSDATLGRLCKDGPIVRNCLSCGFCGAGAGISVGGRHIANWLIGQVRDETQTEEQMRRYAREIDIDENEFVKAYLEVPMMDPAQFERIAKALFTLANQLSDIAYQNVQQARFINERKKAEEKLRHFKMAVECATDAIGMSTPDGRHFYQNQAYTDMFRGMSVEEVDGQSGPPSTVFESEAQGRQIFSTVTAGKPWSGEVRMVNKSGEKLDTLLRGYPIKDDTGKVIGLVGVHSDITESKRAENALRESEEKYRTIFNSAQVGLFRTRIEDGLVIECNNQAARILGFDKREDCIEKLIVSEIYAEPEERKRLIKIMRETGEVDNYETLFLKKGGDIVWVRLTARIYPERGYLEGIIVDFTAQKQAEAERAKLENQLRHAQKMESIGRLAGGVAHDFSNMLTPIIGYTELALMDMNKQDKLYEPLTTIMKAAESASALTKQLLAFSRKQVLQLKVVNLNTIVLKFSKMIQRLIGEDIELHLSLSQSLGNVKVDTDQINQILMNLAVNARDAMPSGGKLTIETANVFLDDSYRISHPYVHSGENVMLAVTDNGCGMDAEIQKHIFEPFYTTKGMTEGTGLGLSTVYGLTKQHGGHIQVYSEVNHGTSFKIYFPQVDAPADTMSFAPEQSRKELPRGTETILLVEDEELIRKLAGDIIELNGYNVLYAGSAVEALEIAGKSGNNIDLLLTDVIMPGMNGKELYEKVSSLVPGVKVIFTSGYTDNVITHHGVLEEGVDFLPKPFSGQSLLLKIRQTLDRSK